RQRRRVRRFEDGGVAGRQRSDAVGVVVEQRKVPGADDAHDAARVVDDPGPLVGKDERMVDLVAERAPPGAPGVVPGQLQRVEELDQLRLVAGLAVLGHQRGHELVVVAQRPGEPAQEARALAERPRGPARLRGARPSHRGLDRRPVGGGDFADDRAGGRVLDAQGIGGGHGPVLRRRSPRPSTGPSARGSTTAAGAGRRDRIFRVDGKPRKLRILVAKVGLDGHDRGAKVVARGLADAGYEVIYSGLHQTPEMVAAAAAQESVDAVGLSIMSGAHMTHFPAVRAALDARGAKGVVLFGGGIVPDDDAAALKAAGVAAIFTPGTPTQAIVDWIEREL